METLEKVKLAAELAEEKKAKDVLVLELEGLTDIADYFLVASGTNERQVGTIAEHIEKGLKDAGVRPSSTEGFKEGRWIIMDYGSFIVHLFLEPLRELYDLESLWIEAKKYRIGKKTNLIGVGDGERAI